MYTGTHMYTHRYTHRHTQRDTHIQRHTQTHMHTYSTERGEQVKSCQLSFKLIQLHKEGMATAWVSNPQSWRVKLGQGWKVRASSPALA